MMEEWDEHMADFVPNDMLSVQLQPRQEIVSLHFQIFDVKFLTIFSILVFT